MALSVPATAVATVMPMLTSSSQGAMWCSKRGKKKNSAYSAVKKVPSCLPTATPSTRPAATISITSAR